MKLIPLLLLLLAAPATAQTTHPCDLPAQTTIPPVTAGVPFTLSWCHDSKDANGTTVSITGWKLTRNTDAPLVVSPTATTAKNSAGLTGYSITRTEAAVGTVIYAVNAASGAIDGAKALVTFTVVPAAGPLSAPSNVRVVIP